MARIWIICVIVFLGAAAFGEAVLLKDCPVSKDVTNCSPKCRDETDCFGQKCCPNVCNTKSCAQPPGSNNKAGNSGYKQGSSGATGTYCGNTKCNSYEKCELDRKTNRQKCIRA